MLFNSIEYFLFLIVVFLCFWATARLRVLRVVLLLLASYVFYMGWNATFVVLIIASTLVDYLCGLGLAAAASLTWRKVLLGVSVLFNLGLLGLFKYADFFIAATAQTIGRWMGDDYLVLGCDGFGRSEAREELRRFFEVDAENIALAALSELARVGKYPKQKLPDAVRALGLNPNKPNPVTV